MRTYAPFMTALKAALLIVALLSIYVLTTTFSVDELKVIASEHRVLGAVVFGFIMFGTTVIAPLTSLPLVPMLAPFLGPFTTGLACYIGWTLGALVAFWIGRRYGKPFVGRYVDMEAMKKYESYIKPEMSFLYITLLHMIIPVDIFSYALGIFTHVSFRIYALATVVGIVWFSFAFAYLGDAFEQGNYVLLASIGVASVLIMCTSWLVARHLRRGEEK